MFNEISFSQRRFAANKGSFRLPSPDEIRDTSKKDAFEQFADEMLSIKTEDYIAPLNRVALAIENLDGVFVGIQQHDGDTEGKVFEIDTESRFFQQLASNVGIGSEEMTKWIETKNPRWRRLAQAAMNQALQMPLKESKDADAKQMIRVMDGKASAFLSNAYGRIDMAPTVDWVRKLVNRTDLMPIHWDMRQGDMALRLVMPVEFDVSVTNRTDNIFFGMELRNSMTGGSSFDLGAFIYRLICTNGMRHTYASQRTRRAHRGQRISEIGMSELTSHESRVVSEVLASATKTADTLMSDKFIDAEILEIRRAQENIVVPKPGIFTSALAEDGGAIKGLARSLEIPQESAGSILKRLWAERSAGLSDGPEITAWGLANAITAEAHGNKPAKAEDMMALGGRVKGWSNDKFASVINGMFAEARS